MRFGAGNKSNGEIGKQGGGNRRSVCVSFSRDSYCLSLSQRYRITRRFSIKCEYRGSCTHSSSSKVCKRFGRGLRLRTAEKWYSSRYSLNVSSRCARYHPADETETERSSIRSFLKFHKKRIIHIRTSSFSFREGNGSLSYFHRGERGANNHSPFLHGSLYTVAFRSKLSPPPPRCQRSRPATHNNSRQRRFIALTRPLAHPFWQRSTTLFYIYISIQAGGENSAGRKIDEGCRPMPRKLSAFSRFYLNRHANFPFLSLSLFPSSSPRTRGGTNSFLSFVPCSIPFLSLRPRPSSLRSVEGEDRPIRPQDGPRWTEGRRGSWACYRGNAIQKLNSAAGGLSATSATKIAPPKQTLRQHLNSGIVRLMVTDTRLNKTIRLGGDLRHRADISSRLFRFRLFLLLIRKWKGVYFSEYRVNIVSYGI